MITSPVLDILIVEDEINSAALAERIKDEFSEKVKIHSNGHGLLDDIAPLKDLDIIIVDQQYTKEDLVHTLKTIRKKSPYTEVIVLSSENKSDVINNIKEAGAYDYIYKDKSTVDKIMYILKGLWSNKKLQKENLHLQKKMQRSGTSLAVTVVLMLSLILLLINLFT